MGLDARWIGAWETRLSNLDQDRTPLPFEWDLDWLGIDHGDDPAEVLKRFNRDQIAASDQFFSHRTAPSQFSLDGASLSFPSQLSTPHAENNTAWAEYFPSARAN